MTSRHCSLLAISVLMLLLGRTFLPLTAQSAAPKPASASTATTTSAPSAPQQAYTLPPDKLAKALALNRIRITLDFARTGWGLFFLWLLLATRGWAAIERWMQ